MKAVSRDSQASAILFWLALTLLCTSTATAQTGPIRPNAPPPSGPIREQDQPPLTSVEEELRAKRMIKLAEKEHEENLSRAREIGEIGKELHESLKDKSAIDRDCLKKIERLEKLTKKVRGEAGGESEEVAITDRPSDISSAVSQIADVSKALAKEVQDTPRQVVSASVIGKANVLLELIRMLRGFTSNR